MEEFKKYYTLPLQIDEYCGNVICKNSPIGYMRAWDWIENEFISEYPVDGHRGEQLARAIVDYINGDSEYKPDYLWSDDPSGDPTIICINGLPCIELRGWGSLTSPNVYGLSLKNAAEIQDQFKDWLIEKLNE